PGSCAACGRCAEVCPAQARERVGRQIPADTLVASLLRDRSFFDSSGGGVTLSGGEIMAQEEGYVRSLLRLLRRQGVHIAVDTCGYAPWQRFERILPDVQVFLYDLKALDPEAHRRYTGVDNALILDNLRRLSDAGARVHLRVPVIPEINLGEMDAMANFVRREIRVERVHLLAYHRLGSDKRGRLGARDAELFTEPGAETMRALAERWKRAGLDDIRIGG
nr:glycyl-radical enzyme activating protein [Clostridia bacterium]